MGDKEHSRHRHRWPSRTSDCSPREHHRRSAECYRWGSRKRAKAQWPSGWYHRHRTL